MRWALSLGFFLLVTLWDFHVVAVYIILYLLQIRVTIYLAKNQKYVVWTTRDVPGACARNFAVKTSFRCAGPTAGLIQTSAFYGGRRVG